MTAFTYTVTESGTPLDGALVRATTDLAGTNTVASGYTDAFGQVVFTLSAGTYYLFTSRAGTNFTNPDTEAVSGATDSGSTDGSPAASGSYANLNDLKAAMQQGGFDVADTADDALLQDALDAATDWIDARTGRVFGSTETEARYFLADAPDRLEVVDASAITEVAADVDGDLTYSRVLDPDDYEVLPLDVGQPGVRGQISSIHVLATSPRQFFPGRRVRVTATWGFGSVPAAIRLATVRLAQRWFKLFRDAPLGVLQGPPDLGTFQTVGREDPLVAQLLEAYVAAPASSASWVVA